MSLSGGPARPLAYIKQALRQCGREREACRRQYYQAQYPSLQTKYPPPSPRFRPSHATKQNRPEEGLKKIPVVPPPRSTLKACPDPIATITQAQIATLDPTGVRTRLFAPTNPERVQVGDILLFRLKSGDPVSGVLLHIRQRHQPIDTAVLLRNHLTRVGVEMWYKIYSPNVEGIEVVQRMVKRARRAKLYYLRQPRHDRGSVEGVVKQYMRQRLGGLANRDVRGRDGNSNSQNKRRGRR